MTPGDVKDYYGSQYRFHKDTGMSANTLGNWLRWGFVPEDAQYKLERITKGKLKHTGGEQVKKNDNTLEAKRSLKNSIKFLDMLKRHIDKGEEPNLSRAMFTAWCLDNYINNKLMEDVVKKVDESK